MDLLKQNTELWGEDIPYLVGLREKAIIACQKNGLPNAKTETWKYSYFDTSILNELHINKENHDSCSCEKHLIKLPFKTHQICFCNGKLHGNCNSLPPHVTLKSLAEAIYDGDAKPYLSKLFQLDNFPYAALNTAFLEQGLMLIIERNSVIENPIFIHYNYHKDSKLLCNIRNIIVLENGAKAEIIEYFSGSEETDGLHNYVNEIFLAPDSVLHHYKLQNEAPDTYHIALNCVQQKTNSCYNCFCAQKECKLARHESLINLLQEGASAEVNGAYRLKVSGVSDITTNIKHLTKHTYSNQLVKGVVDGSSKGIFQGQIHIAPDAAQTEGYQLHRALLLSDNAEVDCKPELEIFADDVKCSHGATCGDLDRNQLFYMQSRGISLEDARKILIEAYLNETIEKITNKSVASWLKDKFQ